MSKKIPIDNNWVENLIRPIALGRSNWLFAGSLRAGKRAAAIKSLIQSARLNGLDDDAAYLTLIRTMFGRFKQVELLGEDVTLVGFDLNRHAVIAVCRKGNRKVRATLDSVNFPSLTLAERLWLQAWKKYSANTG